MCLWRSVFVCDQLLDVLYMRRDILECYLMLRVKRRGSVLRIYIALDGNTAVLSVVVLRVLVTT
jgi:hypothetical protein